MYDLNIEEIYSALTNRKSVMKYVSSEGKIIPMIEQFMSGSEPRTILSGSFHPLHDAHIELAEIASKIVQKPILYELSIKNQDPMKRLTFEEQLKAKITQFENIGDIAITYLPSFKNKSTIFKNSVFAIGYDTALRILDRIYYSHYKDPVKEALSHIKNNNCSFIVAGRFHSKRFRTLKDLSIPKDFQSMFQEIDENKFRNDSSSTKIRKKP